MEINSISKNTFKKHERLKLRKDFKNIFENGKSIQNSYLVILYVNNGLDYSRYGFSIKKKFGKAVKRNRLKRWLREIIRNNKGIIPKGFDYLIIARKHLSKDFDNILFTELKDELLKLFVRINDEKNSNVSD
ncbi:ribonuclease P [Thermosipho affectus]|uniref:Ribonuclease P protein component n=1 Tax=Thermosipho affectus TaxID=660294 RepID=A0ABX3IH81_9BACT|nr:ribonuclease P protein component [Thermosipho affectus]ONN26542.1 ribonuclease P [Thermosipho affectus]